MAKINKPVSKPENGNVPKTKTFSERSNQSGKFSNQEKPGYISKPNIISEIKPPKK